DPPDHRSEAAGDEGPRTRLAVHGAHHAHVAVGVAHRHDGDPRAPVCRPGGAVAYRLAGVDRADLYDPAGQMHDRPGRVRHTGDRAPAIERDARPDEVVVKRRSIEDAGRIGEAGRNSGEALANLREARVLLRIHWMIRVVAA